MKRRGPEQARPVGPIAAAIVAIVALAACASSSTPAPSGAGSTASTPAVSASPIVSPLPTQPGRTPEATSPGQTDTTWGRIWDAIPSAVPIYPGAHPTETGAGPASAILDARTTPPAEIVAFYQTALSRLGLTTVSRDGPREDGSYGLLVGDGASCAVEITAAPLGGSTIITIMYGAGCPFV